MLATERATLDAQATVTRMLHVMNGDSMTPIFAASGIPGTAVVYADALIEGPVPEGLGDAELLRVREAFWSGLASDDEPSVLERWDRGVASYADYDEVVLWFEHDLFDQLLLIRHLEWFARQRARPPVALICVDRFAGIERFKGLGQLRGEQLASLLPARQKITAEQFDLARRAWQAFRSPDPRRLDDLLATDVRALPFLEPSLRRWLQEFPAVGSGLSRSEREILSAVAEAPRSMWSLFQEAGRREQYLFPTDTSVTAHVERLSSAPHPLLAFSPESDNGDRPSSPLYVMPTGTVSITETGRRVLAGELDWLTLVELDRWMGGGRSEEQT